MIDKSLVLKDDLAHIHASLTAKEKDKLSGSTLLLTGCSGFLGFYFLSFLLHYSKELRLSKIIGLDTHLVSSPAWLRFYREKYPDVFLFKESDISSVSFKELLAGEKVNYVVHLASIASPTFYRKYPVQTIDANIWGLRNLLDYFKQKETLKGLLFFSSSEIYGDPPPDRVPTREDYRGNVSCVGPRACYDESKRFGETLCYVFSETYSMPITIVRPFNNYGPGMNLNDKRLPADLAKCVLQNEEISIYSDGTPKRTFCYVSDAIVGYMKALLYGNFDFFNIGIDRPEISVKEFASLYTELGKDIFGYSKSVRFAESEDLNYLTDNPQRRCPDIAKAKSLLGYNPTLFPSEGVRKYLTFIRETKGIL